MVINVIFDSNWRPRGFGTSFKVNILEILSIFQQAPWMVLLPSKFVCLLDKIEKLAINEVQNEYGRE